MNNNSFEQIQNLLTQVNYASKINEIIIQINNIINSQKQMNHMMQMNMMNNNDIMNFENNFKPNINPLLNNQIPQQLNDRKINIVFNYQGIKINIVAEEYLPINEVINRFLKKISKLDLINNYKNEMAELDYSKNVKEINISRQSRLDIVILIKHSM